MASKLARLHAQLGAARERGDGDGMAIALMGTCAALDARPAFAPAAAFRCGLVVVVAGMAVNPSVRA